MNQAITEHKKDILTVLLRKLEDEISELYHQLEEDQSISDDKFKEYDKHIETLYSIHNSLIDEVILT